MSGTLSSLHQGAGVQPQQAAFFKGMLEPRSRHKVPGRMRVGELCKLLLGETLQPLIFPSPRSMPSPQQRAKGRRQNK
jgi:hypothetical protein